MFRRQFYEKGIVTILLTVFVISLAATVFAQKSDIIVFIPKSTDVTYWLFLRKGAADKGNELGYKVDYQGGGAESEIAGQVSLVSTLPPPNRPGF